MKSFNLKTNQSNWLLLFFSCLIVFTALLSEFFHAPISNKNLNFYKNPIPADFVKSTVKMTVKNRMGSFELDLLPLEGGESFWLLSSPRKLPANLTTVNKILLSLQDLHVRKVFDRDPINVANFSLDSPLLNIDLENQEGAKFQVKMGIVNPIDNSTYLSLSGSNLIYQVDILKHPLESFDIPQFIDSHVFSIHQKDIIAIEIFKGKRDDRHPYLSFSKKNNVWYGSSNLPLTDQKVNNLINNILSVKGQIILDRRTANQEKIIQKYLSSPLFTIELRVKNGAIKTYTVSSLINSPIPELHLENNQNIVMAASDRDHPYVIGKDYLSFFHFQDEKLKGNI